MPDPSPFDDTKVVCIWFSVLRQSWILEIREPGDRRFASMELAIEVAKRLGFTHRSDLNDDTKAVAL